MSTAITIPPNRAVSIPAEESKVFDQPNLNISPSSLGNRLFSIFAGTAAASLGLAISDYMSVSIERPAFNYSAPFEIRFNPLIDGESASIQYPLLNPNEFEPRHAPITDLFRGICTIGAVASTIFTICSAIRLEEEIVPCTNGLAKQVIIIGASFTASFITSQFADFFWRRSPDTLFWRDEDSAAHCAMMRIGAYSFDIMSFTSFAFGGFAAYTMARRILS